METFELPYH